ncbi:hypothetical protein EON66_10410 [archaeon]|nr:MAG: hypothetical protein EON66_10410 [archaeon]
MVGGRELPSPVVTGRLNQVVGDDGDVSIPLASRVRLSWNEFVDRHQLPLKRVLVPKHDEEVLAAAHKQHVHASASASGSAHVAARALRPQVNARFLEEVVLTEQAGK